MSQNNSIAVVKKVIRFLLGVPLTVAAFYFIGIYIWNSRDTLYSSLLNANSTLLIIGILFFVAFFFIKNIIWLKILQNLGADTIDVSKSFFLLSFSETKRYIPGSIFAFVSRVQSFKEANIPTKLLVKSLIIESLLLMIPSMLASIPAVIFIYPRLITQFPEYATYILPAIILGTLFSICVICAAAYLARKKLGVKKISFLSIMRYVDLGLLSIVSWICFGIGNYLVASSLHILNPEYVLQFVSFFILAWFVGYISVITPMGLGVREGIMIIGLAPFAPLSMTSLIALFSRVTFMAAEFIFLLITYIIYKNDYVKKIWNYMFQNAHQSILWFGISVYTIYFTFVSFVKYNNFFMGKFDLGNMDQTVWNTIHGRIFQFTNPDGAENISRLAFHADFILVLLSPLYLIWSDPRMLLFVQTITLALGAYFIFKIGQILLKHNTLSLIISLTYLFHPLVQKQNLYDFHAVTLATTFLLAVWYFCIKKRYVWMVIFLLLAVLTKENVYMIAILFGGYLILRKQFTLGFLITAVSGITFVALMKYFIPGARGGEHFALQFLSEFGDSLGSAAIAIISDPIRTFQIIFENNGIDYLKMIFISQGFLSLGSPLYLIFSGPDVAKNLLASNPNFRASYYQYNAEIIPFIFISTLYTVQYLMKKIKPQLITYYLIIFACIGSWLYGALPIGKQPYTDIYTNPRSNTSEISEFLKTIPEDASVAATNNLGSHLSRREYIYVLPNGVNKSDYVLFLNTEWYDPIDILNKEIDNLTKNKDYSMIYENGKFIAFKKIKSN